MNEWNLPEDKKKEYNTFLKSAQDIEMNIGAAQYRIHKMTLMREEVDRTIKSWWDAVISELGLDPKRDYMVNNSGVVVDVTREQQKTSPVSEATIVSELK